MSVAVHVTHRSTPQLSLRQVADAVDDSVSRCSGSRVGRTDACEYITEETERRRARELDVHAPRDGVQHRGSSAVARRVERPTGHT